VFSEQKTIASTNAGDWDGTFIGGAALANHPGGTCSDCHAGENPFSIHPGTALDLGSALQVSGLWYDPIIPAGWPENPSPINSPGVCATCHVAGGPGGRFPAVSTELSSYGNVVLANAINRTLPPGAAGSLSNDPHPIALPAMCAEPPSSPVVSWAGAIWRHTGVACSGQSCPGWRRLDNNVRSVSIVAADEKLYQLHANGLIWESTGQACQDNSCPGWRRLDNNPHTVDIVSGGRELYQLHEGGRIWESTGVPCSNSGCPGWRLMDNNPRTQTLSAAGGILYQLHNDGAIWRSDGRPCVNDSCPGWQRLDNNPRTIVIEASHD